MIYAEAVCNRGINFDRFPRNARLLFAGHCIECLHVVQAVGEFNENNPDVLDHGEHHFTEALSLRFNAAVKTNLIEFADTVH